jgi:multiple sugar transport system permease protein
MLMTMMVPGEMLIITNVINVSTWGWINTYHVLIIPFTASVFYTYFMRQAFMQIPNELYYAAKVDGVSDIKYLTRVMLPMAKATVTTVTILGMMGSWNAFIWPNLVTRQDNMRLVTNGIMEAFKSETLTLINLQMAATVMVTFPILVAFLVFKKYIMRGVSRSGIKG